ncbi:MAG TPA: response regulator [Thermodesulfobacteriota bacterium]
MSTPLRVLMVQDSEDDLRLVERQLRQGGYEPLLHRVDTPEAMAEALRERTWDVVIADYGLPRFSALAALKLLHEQRLDLPFLVVSGRIGEATAVAAMKAGAHDYIMKDNLARLVPAIEREIREAAGRRERRRAEARLRASEARYRTLFESALDAIAVWAESRRLVDANRAYCDLVGTSRDDLLGEWHTPADAVAPEDRERFEAALGELESTGALRGEFAIASRDGGRRLVDVIGMRSAPGLFLSIMRDITERRSLERQLQQAQRMESIGTLAGGVAHDFNNILTGISGFADLALMRLSPAHPLHGDLLQIRKQAEHAAVLTRQLLAFSRRQVLERRQVDLNRIIGEVEAFLRRVIGERIVVDIRTSDRVESAYVDPVQVEQVLMNLCVNARDAMPGGGRLVVESGSARLDADFCRVNAWARPGAYTFIRVTDTGIGMDEATMQSIFDPFFTTKGPGQGTGLGLATVYGIVKQHDGLIQVESEPGKGASFTVYFPVVEAKAERTPQRAAPPARGGHETILLAEDDDMVRELIVRTLEAAGYRVATAADGEQALEAFERHEDDVALAIVDAVMPKLGAREVYLELRARKPGLRFLVVSGYSVNAIDEQFVQENSLPFVQKPFSPSDLVRRVREILDR